MNLFWSTRMLTPEKGSVNEFYNQENTTEELSGKISENNHCSPLILPIA